MTLGKSTRLFIASLLLTASPLALAAEAPTLNPANTAWLLTSSVLASTPVPPPFHSSCAAPRGRHSRRSQTIRSQQKRKRSGNLNLAWTRRRSQSILFGARRCTP